jgi:glycosyltransferase involved in cell wall biosynthesis
MRRLRVGIDGRAFRSPAAGIRRYLQGLVPALLDLDDRPDVVGLGGDPATFPAGVSHAGEPWHPPSNPGWTLVGLPRAAARASVDLIHSPAYTAPFWAGVPVVVTVHDVSYERHPEWYPYRSDRLRRTYYRRSATSASHILTVSNFSAGEIAAAYHIPPERITVAPLGVSPAFSSAPASGRLPAGVNAPFLLHVGDLHARRNLPMVAKAVIDARRRCAGAAPTLVLTGIDRGVADAVRSVGLGAGTPEAVVLLGPVAEDSLHALYRCAAALVYPSYYEGFGLPIIEAMASGTPVIASRAAAIPELTGEAGLLLDPDDRQAWTDAIVAIVSDQALRARMRSAGLARARLFSWARTARATMDVYYRVVASR